MVLLADATPFASVFGAISAPPELSGLTAQPGAGGLNILLSNVLKLLYAIGGVTTLFMFVSGALLWILSGGEKEAVAKARGRIMHAFIGIVLLALTFVIITLLSSILGFQIWSTNPYDIPDYCLQSGRTGPGCH